MNLLKLNCVLACLFGLQSALPAATTTWNSLTAGSLWSVSTNWLQTTPAGNDVVFADVGRTLASTTVGNVVDVNTTISSLSYVNISSWQVTNINSSTTLTLAGGAGNILSVGRSDSNSLAPVSIQGAGKLVINQSNANLQVSGRNLGKGGYYALLDMSKLAAFEATLDTIAVGTARSNQFYEGRLNLAVNNTIKASKMLIGERGTNTQSSTHQVGLVNLGVTNSLSIDQIDVGSERGWGTLQFATGLTGATVSIQGKNSTVMNPTRAILNVGLTSLGDPASTSGEYGGIANFSGGEINAYLQSLNIATVNGNFSGVSVRAEFLMNAGTVDAESVTIAQKLNPGANNTGQVRGLLDIGGGSLATKHLSMAVQGTAGTATAELKIHGTGEVAVTEGGILMGASGTTTSIVSVTESGKLTVAGNIAKGAGTTNATLKVDGGTLELNGHAILVDTFDAKSGTLRNIGEVNSGNAWAKVGADTLRLEGTNTYSGRLQVSAGTLLLAGSASQANLTVKEGANFSMTEDGVLQFNITSSASDLFTVETAGTALFSGAFVFNLDLPLETGSWNLLSGTTLTNYSGLNDIALMGALTGNLVNQGSGLWTLQSGEWQANFNAASGNLSLQAIPEPSTIALFSLSLAALICKRRRA